jgi:hypothetical protein
MNRPDFKRYACPVCNVGKGESCVSPLSGDRLAVTHISREPEHRYKPYTSEQATLQALTNWIVAGNP